MKNKSFLSIFKDTFIKFGIPLFIGDILIELLIKRFTLRIFIIDLIVCPVILIIMTWLSWKRYKEE